LLFVVIDIVVVIDFECYRCLLLSLLLSLLQYYWIISYLLYNYIHSNVQHY